MLEPAGATINTLIGPSQNANWEITGANSGTIILSGVPAALPVTFAGFANLTGPAGTSDAFIVRATGSISGKVTGGASAGGIGGINALAIEDPTEDPTLRGTLALVEFGTAGAPGPQGGTMSPSSVFAGDSTTSFSFVGIENPIIEDTSVPNVLTVVGGVLDEGLADNQSKSNQLQYVVSDTNPVWNYNSPSAPMSEGESLTVTLSSSSEMFNLVGAGNAPITIGAKYGRRPPESQRETIRVLGQHLHRWRQHHRHE